MWWQGPYCWRPQGNTNEVNGRRLVVEVAAGWPALLCMAAAAASLSLHYKG